MRKKRIVDRLATWHICNVLLTTHVRSGFNVLPLEYYLVKDAAPFGAVVLSEFSGYSRVLSGALRVIRNIDDVAMNLEKAITMSVPERGRGERET